MVMIKIINYKIKEIRLLKMNINNCLNFKKLKHRERLFLQIRVTISILIRFKKIRTLHFRNMHNMFRWLRKRIRSLSLHLSNLQTFRNSLRLSKIMVIIIFLLIIIKEVDIFFNILRRMMFSMHLLLFRQFQQRQRIKIFQLNKIAKLNRYLPAVEMNIKMLLIQAIFCKQNLYLRIYLLKKGNSKSLSLFSNISVRFKILVKINLVYKIYQMQTNIQKQKEKVQFSKVKKKIMTFKKKTIIYIKLRKMNSEIFSILQVSVTMKMSLKQ